MIKRTDHQTTSIIVISAILKESQVDIYKKGGLSLGTQQRCSAVRTL